MDVITTHLNADFDCLGAMVAAKKLYSDALMVFPGSQEKSMRDFFLKSTIYVLNFTRLKDVDLTKVTRLILVDCQHSSRIGRFADLVGKPGVEVHIYDHHPEASGDIAKTDGLIRDCGSSTAILAQILREKGITVDPTEATLMMLGIYEDTGSLMFPSTTPDDFHAAAWLLQQGASLNTVADLMTRELTAEQVSLLNDLIKSLKTTVLNGVDVSITHAFVDYYVGDVAALAHMLMDMENLEALFMVVAMANRVYIVARSRVAEVDVGEILREMGGGGHATAASATIKELTAIQVLARLEEILRLRVNPRRTAATIMSSPVKTIAASTSIAKARRLLTRYNVNALAVMDRGEMAGIISRRIVEKALYHDLGDLPVSEYMHTEFMRATPETPVSHIRDYFVGRNRRFVPIFDKGKLVGAVTRTDIMRTMHEKEELYDLARHVEPLSSKSLERKMHKHLSERVVSILRDLGKAGDELNLSVYAVGGFVRDLLLDIGNYDIDVTVEGDGILFAENFARQFGCRCKSHQKFGTAVLIFPDGFKLDVASTRLEYYASPGALPTVERSSLKMDLYRRDFTINTLAICLNTDSFGTLIDYFGAQRDLQERVIRVLHNLSFVEDPTRVFRAIRFEQRLEFHIAKHTENLIKNAVKMNFLDRLGGKRLLNELILILREKEPLRGVERMAGLGLLRFIHPDLRYNMTIRHLFEEARKTMDWFDLLYLDEKSEQWTLFLLVLTDQLNHDQFWGTCTRLSVNERYKVRLFEMRKRGVQVLDMLQKAAARQRMVRRSELYFSLRELAPEILLYMMAKSSSDQVKKYLSLYMTQLKNISCLTTGDDLKKLGVPEGPLYRELLDMLLAARLNGEASTREDEIRLVRAYPGVVKLQQK
ncbi:A-adding tRNA nucleotidyltransferase [Geobacter sp. DSM 9736]|uniref:A-adding tRNA nucleotidyltransferase n=1 Tax=Geobacter sp. DSM 9736 TaxID=1277350 RepID=UPI000B5123C1|nr:A-adding tRNA nucleotidyltransferase [Geobacter sp. DSM 9736]SNB45682.1 tRNA nucleotidyltransferase (CCA-adding enzyme) [Geobacter sp. DSM 9736]